jgi:DNA-binding helix-hairpin-helix protein with protein kinase domain
MTLSGRNGAIRLGTLLGKGGEGAVYALADNPNLVAKVYLAEITRERAAKLQVMTEILTREIATLTAWPKEILRKSDGRIAGFLMDRMTSSKDIHSLYGPKSRLTEFPHADWRLLVRAALNLSKAFHVLHQAGCLIADVNHGGIRVASDGTVKIIDCDSFQITRDGKTHLCEVGTDQFTPPELQQRSFRDTPRTPNHDNFGLAVLIFQLLQMGRHPFAGRYRGSEDMPIPKAIGQFRYAYSANPAFTQMDPPPHTVKPEAASGEIASLWEQAFGRNGVAGSGRPTASQWVSALSQLEKNFSQCSANPTHFYSRGPSSCPWCPIESIGVMLFGLPMLAGVGSGVDVSVVWQQILGVQSPGSSSWASAGSTAALKPSAKARSAKKQKTDRRAVGLIVGVVAFFLGLAVSSSLWLLWIVIAFVVGVVIAGSASSAIEPFVAQHKQLESRYTELQQQYATKRELDAFDSIRSDLHNVHSALGNLGKEREQRYQELVANRQKHALKSYLDKFRIDRASISGIGPSRSAMLESYGIETAADVDLTAVLQVPGFGAAMASKLIAWQSELRRRFRFDPASGVDRSEVLALDRSIAIKRADLEKRLRNGPGALQQHRQLILNRRASLCGSLQEVWCALAQAKVDVEALR